MLAAIWLLAIPAAAQPSTNVVGKIENSLAGELTTKGSADFYVEFADHADVSAASAIADWNQRGEAVVAALQRTADASQSDARKQLDLTGTSYQPFWVVNTILVRNGSDKLAHTLASSGNVTGLRSPHTYSLPETAGATTEEQISAIEWGVSQIRADQVWSTFGVRGEGITVASIDTGVDFDHPALVGKYRGNTGGGTFNHNYNWFDPSNVCGNPSLAPCDNDNRGTHTMGTMLGDDGAGNQVGVAPGARWIAAKGCETANSCSDAALLAAGQWMLAPTDLAGANPRPDLRPNIVTSSVVPPRAADDTWYLATVNAWRAAGIFPAFPNGDAGPSCSTSGSPGAYAESFSSGAFDINGVIASFSSRGPVSGGIKPNLAAPGVNIRSSINGGGYAALDGTAMASAHTAGTVALMWSAAPSLIGDPTETMALLNQTAVDTSDLTCGGTAGNNNVWGEGKLDAFAAVEQSPRGPLGTLTGTVSNASTGAPLAGAQLNITGPVNRTGVTGATGTYQFTLPVGNYSITASASGFTNGSATVTVTEGQTTTQDFNLTPAANHAPTAVNDSYSTAEDTPLTVAAPGVLGNDADADGDTLSVALVTGPGHGTLTLNGNGSFTYTPAANYNGPDSFAYRASDGAATSNTATVSLIVTAVNDAPTAAADSYSTAEDTPLTVAAPGVLGNDADPDGDTLSAALLAGPAHGAVTLNADGSFTYTPAANYNGPDSFTYRATDGAVMSNTATVSVTVTPLNDAPTVIVAAGGTCGSNDLSGTINLNVADPDTAASALTLTATTNNPQLLPVSNVTFGGVGASRTLAATTVPGRTGTATLTVTVSDGTSTNTVIVTVHAGGNGNDTLTGTGGTDMMFGQNGNDTLSGLAGNDLLCGGNGDDQLIGGNNDDTMAGSAGNDRLTGGAGADRFRGGPGTDTATDFAPGEGDTQDGTIP